MSEEVNKAVVSRIATDIWNRGDLDVTSEVMVANAQYHGPHMPNGKGDRENWRQAIAMHRSAFSDSHVTFQGLIPAGDTVVAPWSETAMHTGQLPGVAPTGKRIAFGGITIYRLSGGKIVEAWEQLDMLGMWHQLGIVSLPAPE
jgi:predicted ester cyclase